MSPETIESQFKKKTCAPIALVPEGVSRFRIESPFQFDDGDHLVLVLNVRGDEWIISDEGNTYMRLTYDIPFKELRKGTRQRVISDAVSFFGVEEAEGVLSVRANADTGADAFYSLVQCILRVSDVTMLSRERVKSTFYEDFSSFFMERTSEEERTIKWHDPDRDPEGNYLVDVRLNHRAKPLMIFALGSDDRVRDATITLHQLESWNVPHESIGVFDDQEQVNRKVLARFSDVCDKQFSSLYGNRDRITSYLEGAKT